MIWRMGSRQECGTIVQAQGKVTRRFCNQIRSYSYSYSCHRLQVSNLRSNDIICYDSYLNLWFINIFSIAVYNIFISQCISLCQSAGSWSASIRIVPIHAETYHMGHIIWHLLYKVISYGPYDIADTIYIFNNDHITIRQIQIRKICMSSFIGCCCSWYYRICLGSVQYVGIYQRYSHYTIVETLFD